MLRECHATFAARLATLIAEMESLGYRPRIQQAWRSPIVELAAFKSGRSTVRWGFHCATSPEGKPEALAADVLDDDAPTAPRRDYLLRLAATGAPLHVRTGIEWGLSVPDRMRLTASIAHADWKYGGKVGWDPCHVEVSDLTIASARSGSRPDDSGGVTNV